MSISDTLWDSFTVLRKNKQNKENKKQETKNALRTGNTTIEKKTTDNSEKHKNYKLDCADEASKHILISKELSKNIIKLRSKKKMTQKQLAQKVNLSQSIIQSYENGKAIEDKQIINKILKALK